MDPAFVKARFSLHFNRLTYLGVWSSDIITNPVVRKLYIIPRVIGLSIIAAAIVVQLSDLYLVIGDLRRVTFNLCSSVIVIGYSIIMILQYERRDHLDELRWNLWQDSLKLKNEAEIATMDDAYEKLEFLRRLYYRTCFTFLPMLFMSSYFSYQWGDRELPFAGYLPIKNPMDDFYFLPPLLFEAAAAFYIIIIVIEGELGKFSIIFQLNVYWVILMDDLKKINDIYGDEDDRPWGKSLNEKGFVREVNWYLKKERAKRLLKLIVIRHLELLKYAKKFEFVFSRCFFFEVFGGSLLIVMNGLELYAFSHELSVKLCVETVFIAFMMADLYFLSLHLSNLTAHCTNMGSAAYSTVWHKMDADIRRRLIIIMVRSEKPPRITADGQKMALAIRGCALKIYMTCMVYRGVLLFIATTSNIINK